MLDICLLAFYLYRINIQHYLVLNINLFFASFLQLIDMTQT